MHTDCILVAVDVLRAFPQHPGTVDPLHTLICDVTQFLRDMTRFRCLNYHNRCAQNEFLWLWMCCAHFRRSLPSWRFPPQSLPADLLRTFICDVSHILWIINIGAQGMHLCGCGFVARIPAALCHFATHSHWALQYCGAKYSSPGVYMYIYTYICIFTRIYVYMHTHVCRGICICLWRCMFPNTPAQVYICIYTRICVYIHVYMYIYTHTYVQVYVYVYGDVCFLILQPRCIYVDIHVYMYIYTYLCIYTRTRM